MEIINVSGEIGWSVMPSDIKSQLDKAGGKDIDVHVASPGGFVFDGIEIYNAFRDYKRKYPQTQMMLTIKGLAASMASYLAVNPAFDMVVAEDNAVFMIHNVWGGTVGDYRDMEKSAEIFKGLTDLLGSAYAKKTGKSKKEISKMMDDESWYFGSEIKDAGFVDDMIPSEEKKEPSSVMATAKLSFKNMTDKLSDKKIDITQIAAMIKPCEHPAAISAGDNNITGGVVMTLDELKSQHPALYEAAYNAGKQAGYEDGKKDAYSVSAKAGVFAASKEYPEQVRNLALDVMKGEKSMESLEVLAANADMLKEMVKSQKAQDEQPPETPGENEKGEMKAEGGIINSDESYAAEIARMKREQGRS